MPNGFTETLFIPNSSTNTRTHFLNAVAAAAAIEANLFSNIIFAHFYLIFEIFMPWKSIKGINHVNKSIYLDYLDWASVCSRGLICLRYHFLVALVVHITRFVTQLLFPFGIYWFFFMIHQYLLNIEMFSTEKPAFNLSFMERYWNICSVENDLAVSHLCKIEMSEHLNYFNVQSLGWKWKLFQCNFQPWWNIFVMQKYQSNIKPHLKINQNQSYWSS